MRAANADIKDGIRTALGVKSAADMSTRVEEARVLLDGFRRMSIDRFNRFNFVEATNLTALMS